MLKLLIIVFCILVLQMPIHAIAYTAESDKASDFFKNLSKEKNLLAALYSKNRKKSDKNAKLKPFTLAGEVGVLSTSGNTDTSIVKLAIESNHEMTNWSNRYETQFLSRTNTIRSNTAASETETSRIEVSAQFDYKLVQPNNRLFAYVEYDDNQFNRLRDQATVVIGWSQVAWKEENSEFRYSIGPGYSHLRQTRNNTTIEEMIVRGTLFYNLKFGENARFRQTLSAELGEEIKKVRSQSSITANVFDKLAMKFSINLVLNDNVASQDSILSTQTSISMVYQFF
ncbi:MAG: putative salt-induced outer membrane protein YdiY [Alphaproteobacteria bacterium]|jgi:putative salt-induced outer membrane protein YdiY